MEGDDPHIAMVWSLIDHFDCDCEETGVYQILNLARVELHTCLWVVNCVCVGNPEGEKESLMQLIGRRRVMEFDPMSVV